MIPCSTCKHRNTILAQCRLEQAHFSGTNLKFSSIIQTHFECGNYDEGDETE